MSDFNKVLPRYIGLEIRGIEFRNRDENFGDNEIVLSFPMGMKLRLRDEGQNCCEMRYMTCDDNLTHFIGATFLGYEVREVDTPGEEDEGGFVDYYHDEHVLLINTSLGAFTVVNHNEHNGYYGGFSITAEPIGWGAGEYLIGLTEEGNQ